MAELIISFMLLNGIENIGGINIGGIGGIGGICIGYGL